MARPREFEPDAALDAIKNAFWEKGYEGASMQDLEAATGLKKQSLYRLYGDKRGMYLSALQHYEDNEIADSAPLLAEGPARARFTRLFNHAIDDALIGGDRRGCFLCNAAVDQAPLDARSRQAVEAAMNRVRAMFADALSASSPYDKSPRKRESKAAQLTAAYFGLRVLVKANAPEQALRDAARGAIEAI